eukprot:8603858-Alexandrium_andersonii.AAC.1
MDQSRLPMTIICGAPTAGGAWRMSQMAQEEQLYLQCSSLSAAAVSSSARGKPGCSRRWQPREKRDAE